MSSGNGKVKARTVDELLTMHTRVVKLGQSYAAMELDTHTKRLTFQKFVDAGDAFENALREAFLAPLATASSAAKGQAPMPAKPLETTVKDVIKVAGLVSQNGTGFNGNPDTAIAVPARELRALAAALASIKR